MNTTTDPFWQQVHNTVSGRTNCPSPMDMCQIENALEKARPFGQVKLVMRKRKFYPDCSKPAIFAEFETSGLIISGDSRNMRYRKYLVKRANLSNPRQDILYSARQFRIGYQHICS